MNYVAFNKHLQSITNNSFNLTIKKCCLFITVKSLLTHVYLTTNFHLFMIVVRETLWNFKFLLGLHLLIFDQSVGLLVDDV